MLLKTVRDDCRLDRRTIEFRRDGSKPIPTPSRPDPPETPRWPDPPSANADLRGSLDLESGVAAAVACVAAGGGSSAGPGHVGGVFGCGGAPLLVFGSQLFEGFLVTLGLLDPARLGISKLKN